MRSFAFALLALIIQITILAPAQAQVAAPRMNPLPISLISSWNPAVYSWDGPSRFGGAFAESGLDFTSSGVSTLEIASGDGKAAVFRLVGDSFTFGLDYRALNLDIIASFGGGFIDLEDTFFGVSLQMNEVFSIGLGQESGDTIFGNELSTETLPLAGATLRLGEVFYLGLATGTETVEEEDTLVPGSAVEGERGVTRIGMAYYSRNDENGLHLEVWREEIDAINTSSFTNDSTEATGFMLEVVFSNILLGFESVSGEDVSPTNGSVQEEQNGTTLSLGWVPREGLSLVVSINEIEIYDTTLNQTIVINVTFAGVSWAF